MKILGIDKISSDEVIFLLGKPDCIDEVWNELCRIHSKDGGIGMIFEPNPRMHFTEYPSIAANLMNSCDEPSKWNIISTQSAEFIDAMLESEIDFVVVTARACPDGYIRLRRLEKDEAIEDRKMFNMEFR